MGDYNPAYDTAIGSEEYVAPDVNAVENTDYSVGSSDYGDVAPPDATNYENADVDMSAGEDVLNSDMTLSSEGALGEVDNSIMPITDTDTEPLAPELTNTDNSLDLNADASAKPTYEIIDSPQIAGLKNTQQGYTELIVVIVVFALLIGGVIFYFVTKNKKPVEEVPTSDPDEEEGHDDNVIDDNEASQPLNEKYDTATTENEQ